MAKVVEFCVYRYIDKDDEIIKYVGISRCLKERIAAHRADEWVKGKAWRIEYFPVESQSEAEAFESHLISLYNTGIYFNRGKSSWGVNRFLPDTKEWWQIAYDCPFLNSKTLLFAQHVRQLLKNKEYDTVRELLPLVEMG